MSDRTEGQTLSVLQVVTRRQLRGAEVFAAQLSGRLRTLGLEVRLVGLYPPGDPPLEVDGVATRDLFPRAPRGVSPPLVVRLARELRRSAPDIVQANGSDTLKYTVLACLWAGRLRSGRDRPALIYRNISISSRWLKSPLHRLWNRWLLHRVDHVVAVSDRSRGDLQATYGLPGERITVLPRAVATDGTGISDAPSRQEFRAALCREAGCDPGGPVIVHIGSFTPEKNHRGMLDVLARLRAGSGWLERTQMVFFGDGPLRPDIEAEAQRRGLGERTYFPGPRRNAPELIAGADVLLLFSHVEGMPGVVLEAGARGVPVVVSDVGGVREAVRDGENGRIVPAADVVACADALESLLGNEEERHRLGATLRATVRERFDLDRIAERYCELYRSLLAAPGAGASS